MAWSAVIRKPIRHIDSSRFLLLIILLSARRTICTAAGVLVEYVTTERSAGQQAARCRLIDRTDLYHFRFLFCMESASYVRSFRMVFFYLVTTSWIFDISLLCEKFNQSIINAKAALVRNYLEVYWPCAGGLSAVNAIGTQLRGDPINSGPTRWRMAI